jgi:hypothetical protein
MLCSNLLLGLLLPTLMSVSCEPVEFQGKLMTVRLLHNQRLPSAKTKKKKKTQNQRQMKTHQKVSYVVFHDKIWHSAA